MIEYGVAQISITRCGLEYPERKLSPSEVVAVQAWVDTKTTEREQLCPVQAGIVDAELSLSAQAVHHHGEQEARLFELGERFKQNLTDVLQPAFPEGASLEEKQRFVQDRRDDINKEARALRVEKNLAKSTKTALASSLEETPALKVIHDDMRALLVAHDEEVQSGKRKRDAEKADDRERQKAATVAVRAEKTAARVAAKEIVAIAPVSAAPAAPVVPAVAQPKTRAKGKAKTEAKAKAKGKAKGKAKTGGDAPMFDMPVHQASLDSMFKGAAPGVASLADLEAAVAQDEREAEVAQDEQKAEGAQDEREAEGAQDERKAEVAQDEQKAAVAQDEREAAVAEASGESSDESSGEDSNGWPGGRCPFLCWP